MNMVKWLLEDSFGVICYAAATGTDTYNLCICLSNKFHMTSSNSFSELTGHEKVPILNDALKGTEPSPWFTFTFLTPAGSAF